MPVQSELISSLLTSLRHLKAADLGAAAAAAFASQPSIFNPATIVTPALVALTKQQDGAITKAPEFLYLWSKTAEFLLTRSEWPPIEPEDWHQDVAVPCNCAECRALQAFARDPIAQTHRFRVRKELRRHLHAKIDSLNLDMTHVTDRTGSPQTLVCTKTRGTYQKLCQQFKADIFCFQELLFLIESFTENSIAELSARMAAAVARGKSGAWTPDAG